MGTPPTVEYASLGMADTLILMVMALVVFGPRRLPQIGRQIGKLMYEFRKASNDFKFQMEEELRAAEEADRRRKEEEERQRTLALNPPADAAAQSPETPVNAIESPYADEGKYPEVATPAAEPEAGGLRVQPPSTGEQVAAARPGSATEPETQSEPAESAAPQQGAPDTEAVSHNG